MTTLYQVAAIDDHTTVHTELRTKRAGWVVADVRPNLKDHGQGIWADVLTALAHHRSPTHARAIAHAELLVWCWLAADGITDVAFTSSQDLSPALLNRTAHHLSAFGTRVWYVFDTGTHDERDIAATELQLTAVTTTEFITRRQQHPERTPPRSTDRFPTVPSVHHLGFVQIARALMPPADANAAIDQFTRGRDQMRRHLADADALDEHTVAAVLHDITVHTNDINELTAIVRGAQTAAFAAGWNVHVDIDQWAARGRTTDIQATLTADEWARITELARPYEAAVCVLSAVGFSCSAIIDIDTGDVATDGATVHDRTRHRTISVPEPARGALAAHHLYRVLQHHTSDRYIVHTDIDQPITTRWAGRLLRTVTRDTGVALRAWNATREATPGTGWRHRSGIAVERLT